MKKKFKRVVAVIMAVCLLFVSVPPVQSNAAGYITPGMLFSFMSSLYGVYVQANQADNEMGAFENWLTKKVSDIKDSYSSAKEVIDAVKAGNMEKVVMSVSLMTVAKEFFLERTADVGGITGGSATTIKDTSIYFGVQYANNSTDQIFRNWVLSGSSDINLNTHNIIGFRTVKHASKYDYVDVYLDTVSNSYTKYLTAYDGQSINYKYFTDAGVYYTGGYNFSFKRYIFNPLNNGFTYDMTSSSSINYSSCDVCFLLPVLYTSSYSSNNLSTLLSTSTVLNGNVFEPIYTVTGGYQAGTIDKLSDKELSAAQLEAINSAVKTAVLDNTTTSEEDDTLVYAPDISIDLANALSQALVDQGVITDETTGEDTGTTDKPVVVPTDPATFGIDLTKLFPFCIPFDLYDMLNVLCADPVAPSFDWEIMSPTGKKEKFTIDLSVFDSVAQVVRTLELLGFCVGLAFKTRDLIRG